ncbi:MULTISPECIES: hypothetical protein [unclassified Candidatus Tisiphia]|uniref:hypothetical protein n=1 Tax=unclassified Candidatus Tisiphia TaxID=2996318 RepID=UPI00312C6E52
MAKSQDLNTAVEYQSSGEHYYNLAADMEDRDEPQKKIDACWRIAVKDFWQALTLGSEKAPIWLFKCFRQGVGVEENPYIRDLMYGAALELTPQDAKNIKAANIPVIDKSMKPAIKNLTKLVQKTHKKIADKEITTSKMLDQMDEFNHAIKLPGGKLIQSCFISKSSAATTHDEYGASSSAHNASYETCPDTSFGSDDVGAMGGESPYYPPHH